MDREKDGMTSDQNIAEWLPIETAPKDRPILSTNRYGVVSIIMWWETAVMREDKSAPPESRFTWKGAWDDGERGNDLDDDAFVPYEPKFWRPLPAPPEPQP